MPRCLIDDEDGVSARRYGLRDLVEMPVHGVEVAPGQHEGHSLARAGQIAPKIQAERVR